MKLRTEVVNFVFQQNVLLYRSLDLFMTFAWTKYETTLSEGRNQRKKETFSESLKQCSKFSVEIRLR